MLTVVMKKAVSLALALMISAAWGGTGEPAAEMQSPQSGATAPAEDSTQPDHSGQSTQEEEAMKMVVRCNDNTIVFDLNDSQAAKELYRQLPMTIEVQNYASNEKIFYPPQTLDVDGAPQASGGVGSLAYYAPWGDVVMFYQPFSPSSGGGLYELGQAASGSEWIESLTGAVELDIE